MSGVARRILATWRRGALYSVPNSMLTGEIRSKIDALWNAFWTGGISNPLEVIEQITYSRALAKFGVS